MITMKMRIAAMSAAFLGLVGAAGYALADPGGFPHGGMGRGGMMMQLFDRYDANKDGKLSQQEIDQNRQSWHAEFDANKDGALDLGEFEKLWLKARREEMVREFQFFDADGDGKVTLEEYQKPLANIVANRDRNGDGVLSRDDRPRRMHDWRKTEDGKDKGATGSQDEEQGQ